MHGCKVRNSPGKQIYFLKKKIAYHVHISFPHPPLIVLRISHGKRYYNNQPQLQYEWQT